MEYDIKISDSQIMATKKIKRYLFPGFAIIGLIFSIFTVYGYYTRFFELDMLTLLGFSLVLANFSNFIELYLSISSAFIAGTFYFCCWKEGWEISKLSGDQAQICFFKGFGPLSKKEYFNTKEISSIYLEKINIDQLGMLIKYTLKLVINQPDQLMEKSLLSDSNYVSIHTLGVQVGAFFQKKIEIKE